MRSLTSAYLDEEEIDGELMEYCLVADPYYCEDCNEVQRYLHILLPRRTVAIITFETKDDEHLLQMAIIWKKRNKNPRIIEYDPNFGLSISREDVFTLLGVVE